MRLWAVIGIAVAIGAAVHGRRMYQARLLRKRQEYLLQYYAPPAPTFSGESYDWYK